MLVCNIYKLIQFGHLLYNLDVNEFNSLKKITNLKKSTKCTIKLRNLLLMIKITTLHN